MSLELRRKVWAGDKNMGVNSRGVIFKAVGLGEITGWGGKCRESRETLSLPPPQGEESRWPLMTELEGRRKSWQRDEPGQEGGEGAWLTERPGASFNTGADNCAECQ